MILEGNDMQAQHSSQCFRGEEARHQEVRLRFTVMVVHQAVMVVVILTRSN